MRFFSFSLLIGAGAVLGHLYLYRRLVRKALPESPARRLICGALVAMAALLLLRGPIRDLGPGIKRAYEVFAYGWMAIALCLLIAVACKDLGAAAATLFRWLGRRLRTAPPSSDEVSPCEPPVDRERRRILGQALHVGVVAAGGGAAAYGMFRAFAPPEVSEVAIRLPNLPRALDGLSIVQLTDVHVGPFIGEAFIEQLVETANAQRPDLVAITGDLVDGHVAPLGSAVAKLAGLRSRYGTYFVTGNHEYHSDDREWCRFLEQIGVHVLRNRRVAIGDAGGRFDLIGVDDWGGGRRRGGRGYDLDAALAGRDPERAALLLAHQPSNFETAAARGIGLQLSGHTHGGQLFPMTMLVGLGWKYSRGLYRHGDSHIYVSRGCGFWGPPARIDSPPEIVKVHLTV